MSEIATLAMAVPDLLGDLAGSCFIGDFVGLRFIGDFVGSWPLFQTTYLAGWMLAVLLAGVGVWVVAREQIFLGVAVSQASALGIAVALVLGVEPVGAGALEEFASSGLAVLAAVATALVSARVPREGGESPEAVTGFVFLLAASLPTLLLSRSPHGLEEIQRLAFSTLLGASELDLLALGGVTLLVAGLAWRYRSELVLVAVDPEMARAVGLRPRAVRLAVAVVLGICVGLAMRIAGLLYTFGLLVLPALLARSLSREIRPLLWRSPLVALGAAVPAFVLAHGLDTPPAHTTVALLCAGLGAAWLWRRLRPRG